MSCSSAWIRLARLSATRSSSFARSCRHRRYRRRIEPKAALAAVTPSFIHFAAWLVLCGIAFVPVGIKTGKGSNATIDGELADEAPRGKLRLAVEERT